jgi:hypothetical protein
MYHLAIENTDTDTTWSVRCLRDKTFPVNKAGIIDDLEMAETGLYLFLASNLAVDFCLSIHGSAIFSGTVDFTFAGLDVGDGSHAPV